MDIALGKIPSTIPSYVGKTAGNVSSLVLLVLCNKEVN